MTTFNIRQIKQQIKQLANETSDSNGKALPSFWLTDWLLYVIDKPALFLITDDDYQLTDSELDQFNTGITNMQQGMPLAYLTGQQEFWSLDFKVNAHTLIPRPDTEVLVEQVLRWIGECESNRAERLDKANNVAINHNNPNDNKRLLDLGTGSGCIAISLAHELQKDAQPNWQVVAVDISAEALEVAEYNAAANNTQVAFMQSSWYEALSTNPAQRFDVIVSNPPYIDESDEHLIDLQAEPISALSAPEQGLADIAHIVQYAPQFLQAGGLLAIEHGYDQGKAVRKLFLERGFKAVKTVSDYGGNDRVTLGEI
ncbi:peptide chain release factor N(5)-glutamine methyltransferase [Psychrobacter jeotgali]|uniref:peptide chain release factor N(5)-glutamine methyltransferase n=1 Tax=Psychrobacter jeotgali TaxID=179010 RepID=UPI0019188E62|nr:peptide chain release factor N(5)-glutamine methyltransferase [Psychrobacter jeotgali]